MQGTKLLRATYAFTVLGATALVAYFQALGANELVEASLPLPLLQPPRRRPPVEPVEPPAPAPPPLAPEPRRDDRPKLVFAGAPACDGLELKIASQAADPLASRATVRHTGGPSGQFLHQGSVFDDMHLLHVGYDGLGVTPVAWFLRGEAVCQLRMFSQPTVPAAPAERAALPAAEQALQNNGITPLGPGSFQVDRALVERLMADPAARDEAYAAFERGASGTYALKFRRVRPGGWAHALGLRVGDRLTSVNGHPLKDPRHAIEAYAALRMTSELVLKLERGGKLETVQIAIR